MCVTAVLAIGATAILIALAVFHAQLASGRPLGRYAWGGAHTVLPRRLRIGSALAIVLYAAIAFVLLDHAGVVDVLGAWTGTAVWVLVGFFLLGVALNAASRSPDERRVMTPVALALCLLCLGVALGG